MATDKERKDERRRITMRAVRQAVRVGKSNSEIMAGYEIDYRTLRSIKLQMGLVRDE